MTRNLLLIFAIGIVPFLGTVALGQDEQAEAAVVVTIPADAQLLFDGTPTQQTGTTRNFTTPPLTPGSDYHYTLTARMMRNGQPVTETRRVVVRAGETTPVDFTTPEGATETAEPAGSAPATDDGWPRQFTEGDMTFTVYQPQIDTWQNGELDARAAVAVATKASAQPTYGVINLTARTHVDKENQLVTLDSIQLTNGNFPTAPDRANAYLDSLRRLMPMEARTLSLARLEANLAVTQAEAKHRREPVRNDPPDIIFSPRPAILVLIDGQPVLRQVTGSNLLRVINTRAALLLDQAAGTYYLHIMDRWMDSKNLGGPWTVAENPPAGLHDVLTTLSNNGQVDPMDNLATDLQQDFENGTIPTIYVRTHPSELITTNGEPELAPIEGTKLLWVRNSTTQVMLDTVDSQYYVLFSGRWFRSRSLRGPWEFVPSNRLPVDFALIPDNHPRGDVLTSVTGTPQANESVIANGIPQTATIKKSEVSFQPTYDGDPQFKPIEGTALRYAVNSPTPIIQVEDQRYYALFNGVWFTSAFPNGPWVVASSVPQAIYDIPTSSPLYYVTNAYIYDSTPDVVYCGYTPGYFGTVVCPQDVVVFGTGGLWQPWIGNDWFGCPWTYGCDARFGWTLGGWGFGFGVGCGGPWWGPYLGFGGFFGSGGFDRFGRQGRFGGFNRFGRTHINNVNFANVNTFNRFGNRALVSPARRFGAPLGATTTHNLPRGLNNTVAGRDGNVYRRTAGGWEHHTAQGWQPAAHTPIGVRTERPSAPSVTQHLDNAWQGRQLGAVRHQTFQSAAPHFAAPQTIMRSTPSFGGVSHVSPGAGAFHGSFGGFRGGGGGFHGGGRGRR